MQVPHVHGVIRRRLLVNFRVDAALMQRHLPSPFLPKLHNGHAVAGICLIRLEEIRPKRFPRLIGLSSENAAHRVAVVWEDADGPHEGVYIPRRDTGSLLTHLAGGRMFPGEHQRAAFHVRERGDAIELNMKSADGVVQVDLAGSVALRLPPTSIFRTLEEASAFFEPGTIGYSATASGRQLDGVALKTHSWSVSPLSIDRVFSSYFADERAFPAGTLSFDCALIMRNIAHEWQAREPMYL